MRLAEFIRKYLPLWVALDISLALLIGYHFPEVRALKAAIPFFLFLILYPMMINLRVEDIGKALRNPRLVSMALVMNFLLTPLLGALWAHLIFRHTDPYLSAGFILKVLVPGSGMVTAWTGFAKGKVESALIIVALSYILAIFLVPLWMWVLAGAYVQIDPLLIFQKMLLIIVLPLAAGLLTRRFLVRRYGTKRYQSMAPLFPTASTCGMLPLIFTIISTQARLIVDNYQWVLLVVLGIATLYPLLFTLAILFSKVAHVDHGDCMALGYSVTAKSHAITIGVATTAFSDTLAVLPAAVAPVIQIPIMLLFLNLSERIRRFLQPEAIPSAGG